MLIVQAALVVLPHRQYKTARTETRCHLLLKIWQMAIQTSASRGYVLLREYRQVRHKSPTNCLPGCGHDPRSAPNLERHGSSMMQTFGWLEIPHFLTEIPSAFSHEIRKLLPAAGSHDSFEQNSAVSSMPTGTSGFMSLTTL